MIKKNAFGLLIALLLLSTQVKSQDSGFGIGMILGDPTGISLKGWLNDVNAIDASVSWSFQHNGFFNITADYVWHFDLIPVTKGKFPLYVGPGARMGIGNDFWLGARVPVGLDYMFEGAPVDIFIEIAPGLNLFPSTDFFINGGIGARFFFE
ncbi:MAG: hypothetical protein U9R60_17415 [Bacteroidota bacterium]|nr:hypothetical protein [Bacteroidota bacterium]